MNLIILKLINVVEVIFLCIGCDALRLEFTYKILAVVFRDSWLQNKFEPLPSPFL